MKRKRKPKIGDVFEIPTPKGLAYVQYIYYDPVMGDLLRILPGLYPERPSNLKELVRQKERFVIFHDVESLEDFLKAEFVAHEEVPEHAKTPPLFRMSDIVGVKGNKWVWGWWVTDIQRDTWRRVRKKELTEEFFELPEYVLISDEKFLERLMDLEWTWSKERELPGGGMTEMRRGTEGKEKEGTESEEKQLPHVVHHFLYFRKKWQAEAAAKEIDGKVYKVLVRKLRDRCYSVVVINWFFRDEEFWDKVYGLDEELEELAKRYGGEFDWHEIGLVPGKDPFYEDYKGEG